MVDTVPVGYQGPAQPKGFTMPKYPPLPTADLSHLMWFPVTDVRYNGRFYLKRGHRPQDEQYMVNGRVKLWANLDVARAHAARLNADTVKAALGNLTGGDAMAMCQRHDMLSRWIENAAPGETHVEMPVARLRVRFGDTGTHHGLLGIGVL